MFLSDIWNGLTNPLKGILRKGKVDRIIKEEWWDAGDRSIDTLVIHHSAEEDSQIRDWSGIDEYHRSFRINWDSVASPQDITRVDISKCVQYKRSWYLVSEMTDFYDRCKQPFASVVHGYFGKSYFQSAWSQIAYHLGIEEIGGVETIQYGRSLKIEGGHTALESMNMRSIGLVVLGDFERNYMKQEKWDFLVKVIKEIVAKYPSINIIGHKEVEGAKTTCPGKNISIVQLKKEVSGG